ncbi:MAG: hypothetical protein V1857_04870 [archaeon]
MVSSMLYRRTAPLVLGFLLGLLMVLEYYVPTDAFRIAATSMRTWAVVIATIAIGFGLTNVVRIHYADIKSRRKGTWPFSVWMLVIIAVILVLGLTAGTQHVIYRFFFDNMFMLPYNTVVTFLCFSTFSAGYRAVKARSLEGILLLIGTVFVMMWYAPIGEILWSGFPTIGKWIYDVPSTGSMRAIMIGAAIGSAVLGIKTLIGLERGWLGRREE